MSKKLDVIGEYQSEYKGQQITVHKLKMKDRKALPNAARRIYNCPNCSSLVRLNSSGIQECSGDRLRTWELEFAKYHALSNENKVEYIKNISSDSKFLELYDRWAYAFTTNQPEEFTCGYTNKIYLPIASNRVNLPDPIFMKIIESKLGRKLELAEILGEDELWLYGGMVLQKYRKGAKKVRVPIVTLPDDV